MGGATVQIQRVHPDGATALSRQRLLRFLIVGTVSTAISYGAFIGALRVAAYPWAAGVAWVAGLVTGFTLNRRFTFGIRGKEGRGGEFVRFASGTLLQLGITEVGYWLLIGLAGWGPQPAFVMVLLATTAFSFAYHNLITFRPGGSS